MSKTLLGTVNIGGKEILERSGEVIHFEKNKVSQHGVVITWDAYLIKVLDSMPGAQFDYEIAGKYHGD
jgi:quercetin dioxygenase-like cupin family protein